MKPYSLLVAFSAAIFCNISTQAIGHNILNETDTAFFATDEAARIGTQIVAYQRVTGGWPKNIDMGRPLTPAQLDSVVALKPRTTDSTTDNGATTAQMKFLARLYAATRSELWREAFIKGVEYLLSGQYDNGGWPQFWPNPKGYQVHITYNDDAMANTLSLIRDLRDGKAPYDAPGIVDEKMRERLDNAFRRGVECILATQIVVDGEPTVWCQQHDRETLAPASARAYELPSFCSTESMTLVWLLMDIPNPDERICRAVEGAMKWFDRNRIDGFRYVRRGPQGTRLMADPSASTWARYYDLVECRPFVCDRDGIPKRSLDEIGRERRDGYAWYSGAPASLFPKYEQWRQANGR